VLAATSRRRAAASSAHKEDRQRACQPVSFLPLASAVSASFREGRIRFDIEQSTMGPGYRGREGVVRYKPTRNRERSNCGGAPGSDQGTRAFCARVLSWVQERTQAR